MESSVTRNGNCDQIIESFAGDKEQEKAKKAKTLSF
jgi:hypothetical protein